MATTFTWARRAIPNVWLTKCGVTCRILADSSTKSTPATWTWRSLARTVPFRTTFHCASAPNVATITPSSTWCPTITSSTPADRGATRLRCIRVTWRSTHAKAAFCSWPPTRSTDIVRSAIRKCRCRTWPHQPGHRLRPRTKKWWEPAAQIYQPTDVTSRHNIQLILAENNFKKILRASPTGGTWVEIIKSPLWDLQYPYDKNFKCLRKSRDNENANLVCDSGHVIRSTNR